MYVRKVQGEKKEGKAYPFLARGNCERKEGGEDTLAPIWDSSCSRINVSTVTLGTQRGLQYKGVCAQLHLTLCNPMDCSLPGSSVHGISQAKTLGVACHFLLQGIFPTQG